MTKRKLGSVGEWWFARMNGAGALVVIELMGYHGGNVWQYRRRDGFLGPDYPSYGEHGVDFELVNPWRAPETQEAGQK